jgi:hypothetical protein
MRDGLDVRATLRHWTESKIYVREEKRGHLNFTNAAVDWTSATEYSAILRGGPPGGWIDPSQTRLGSCSRTIKVVNTMLQLDPYVQLDHREFSFLTLDPSDFSAWSRRGGIKKLLRGSDPPVGRNPKNHGQPL